MRAALPLARVILALSILAATGCDTLSEPAAEGMTESGPSSTVAATLNERVQGRETASGADSAAAETQGTAPEARKAQIFEGTGKFIDREAASAESAPPVRETSKGDIVLNFENAPLREVVRYALGEVLGLNYTIAPGVKGEVTMATTRPLSRDALLPTLERILRLNGAALVRDGELYRVAPMKTALQGGLAPSLEGDAEGLSVRIVPLEYISASEMQKILKPFVTTGGIVRVDQRRNLLILAGTNRELKTWLRTVQIFDVDWLEGMSVGLFPLENTEAPKLVKDLRTVTGGKGKGKGKGSAAISGMFRLVPIERLNSIMAVTRQPEYLRKIRTWVNRLDDAGGTGGGQELHVYRMQHGKAADIAQVLQKLFGGDGGSSAGGISDTGPSLAPSSSQSSIGSSDGLSEGGDLGDDSGDSNDSSSGGAVASTLGGEDTATSLDDKVRIIADKTNNALLVMANNSDYRTVRTAIKKLDIAPLQVLVDATIVEVTLSGRLRYGLQWFFKNNAGDLNGRGVFSTGQGDNLASTFPGFNYSLVDNADQVRAVLSALAEDSRVNVVSAPSVMVLDNQEARIRVGDRVPVRTSQRSSNLTDNAITVSNIQYRDTGVILEVVPRVNASGQVTMEIRQEVNDVATTQSSGIDSPTIQQRLVESTVAVDSGQSIVLGGLIRENEDFSNSGVPVLRQLPLIGNLFSQTIRNTMRTELLVLLTPTVARNAEDARAITEEFRQKLGNLTGMRRAVIGEPATQNPEPQLDGIEGDDRGAKRGEQNADKKE